MVRTMLLCAVGVLTALLALAIATRPAPPAPTAGSPTLAAGPPVDAGFADPALSGMCEVMTAALAEGDPGEPTREEAVAALVESGELPDELNVEGHRILFEGEPVGAVSTTEVSAGGYVVVSYEWCHP